MVMLTFSRLRAIPVPLTRVNASLESLSSVTTTLLSASFSTSAASTNPPDAGLVSPPATKPRTQGRRNTKYPAIRPSISLERPREWNPPVAPGVIPAYDEAVAYIRADAAALQAEADALRSRLEKGQVLAGGVEDAKNMLNVLEVMAQVNLPEVRWKAANGMADMSQKVYRHLVEQRWRNEGALDLLMERLYQMHVIPDILPDLQPTVELRVVFPEAPPKNVVLRARTKRKTLPVEAGVFLVNEQTRRPPKLYTTVFHPEPRLYTLLMVDPDVPDEDNQTFKTFLHWLHWLTPICCTYPLSSPHPALGTPYHRYVLLLLPHEDPTLKLSLPPGPLERDAFDVRRFVQEHALRTDEGGAFMWRAVWDEESSRIWETVIKKPEPRYGYPLKPDPYAALEVKKYA
ncbi:phosphatidylethanolamine-binding protein [Russula dissimulans]|nr:phosphatidylethanolamine-binding protein [Russula dissimulans]